MPEAVERLSGRSSGGDDWGGYVPLGKMIEYKPRSVFAEHKALTILFVLLALGMTAFWIKSVKSPHIDPPPTTEVYIESLPPPAAR